MKTLKNKLKSIQQWLIATVVGSFYTSFLIRYNRIRHKIALRFPKLYKTDDNKIIIHVKTKDLNSAKVNFLRYCSVFKDNRNPDFNMFTSQGKEFSTDVLGFQKGSWIYIVTPEEIINWCDSQDPILKMLRENQ
jgi:hypothetical protein